MRVRRGGQAVVLARHVPGRGPQPRGAPGVRGGRCAAVRAFYTAAMDAGAESLHAPRLWPEYHPGYYGAFVRDPDGNNVEAVVHSAAPED